MLLYGFGTQKVEYRIHNRINNFILEQCSIRWVYNVLNYRLLILHLTAQPYKVEQGCSSQMLHPKNFVGITIINTTRCYRNLWYYSISDFPHHSTLLLKRKLEYKGSQVGHMWITYGLFCELVSQQL